MPYNILRSITLPILKMKIQHCIQGKICYLMIVFSNVSTIAFSSRAGKFLEWVLQAISPQRSGVKPLRIWLPSQSLGSNISYPSNLSDLKEKHDPASFFPSGITWTGQWLFLSMKMFPYLVSNIWICFVLHLSDHTIINWKQTENT